MGDADSSVICLGFNDSTESQQCISISSDEAENSDDEIQIVDSNNPGFKKKANNQSEQDIIVIEDSPAAHHGVGPAANRCVETENIDCNVNFLSIESSTSTAAIKEKKVPTGKRCKQLTTLTSTKKQKCDKKIVKLSDTNELGVIVINNTGPLINNTGPLTNAISETRKPQHSTSNSSTVFFTIDKVPTPILAAHTSNIRRWRRVTKKKCEKVTAPPRLRPISIDGSNVAMAHGKEEAFSCYGIKLCIDFFLKRGHTEIKAFVPQYRRRKNSFVKDQHILEELAKGKQFVVFTPSREVEGSLIASYDDRFIIDYAIESNGVIVSNDNYRDLMNESEQYKETIKNRLLMFAFADDMFMIPRDPLGKYGPNLDKFLQLPG